MGFFGTIISQKKRSKISIPSGNGLQLCGATLGNLGTSIPTGFTTLFIKINSRKFALCSLSETQSQCHLNQSFVPDDSPVELMVEGGGTIHLTGFWDTLETAGESDNESEEEPIEKAQNTNGPAQSDEEDREEEEDMEKEDEQKVSHPPTKKRKVSMEEKPETMIEQADKAGLNKNSNTANEENEDQNKKKKKKKKKKKSKNAPQEAQQDDTLKVPESKIKPRNIKGMTVKDVIIGAGKTASKGQKVGVLYEVSSPSGEVYDKNWNQRKPLIFRIGVGEVIEGVEKGVQGMKVNGERILNIPPELGYGKKGAGPIRPNSQLVFHLKLVSVG